MEECQTTLFDVVPFHTASKAKAIDFMQGYYREQVAPDYHHDPKEWREVINPQPLAE